ncbi:MAG: hypothetical protein AB1758_07735 [Candidatus Eremiobacterota bacterium]
MTTPTLDHAEREARRWEQRASVLRARVAELEARVDAQAHVTVGGVRLSRRVASQEEAAGVAPATLATAVTEYELLQRLRAAALEAEARLREAAERKGIQVTLLSPDEIGKMSLEDLRAYFTRSLDACGSAATNLALRLHHRQSRSLFELHQSLSTPLGIRQLMADEALHLALKVAASGASPWIKAVAVGALLDLARLDSTTERVWDGLTLLTTGQAEPDRDVVHNALETRMELGEAVQTEERVRRILLAEEEWFLGGAS